MIKIFLFFSVIFFLGLLLVLFFVFHRFEKKYWNVLDQQYHLNQFNKASRTKRLLGFFIDLLIFTLCDGGLSKITQHFFDNKFFYFCCLLLLHALYFGMMELKFGKTFGKMIVGTSVIEMNGNALSTRRCWIRYFCRWIPFDAFSFLIGKGWHDTFSHTVVVNAEGFIQIEVTKQ